MVVEVVVPELDEFESLDDFTHNCEDYLDLRERKIGNGSSYVMQCLFCGEQKGNAISKRSIPNTPPPFDADREPLFEARRISILEKKATIRTEKSRNFSDLPPSAYDLKKRKVEEFERQLSELWESYCAETSEEDISSAMRHMLNRQREGVIRNYHSKFSNEGQLAQWFTKYFCRWFHVYPEVSGRGYVGREERNVRIDFVIRPKRELVDKGVKDSYLGIEVKFLDPMEGRGFHGKSSQSVFQALSYSYAGTQWFIPEEQASITLDAVLIFSNLSFQSETNQIFKSFDHHYEKVWKSYLRLANHAGVGEVQVSDCGWKDSISRWDFHFAGSNYLSWIRQKDIVAGNQNTVQECIEGLRLRPYMIQFL